MRLLIDIYSEVKQLKWIDHYKKLSTKTSPVNSGTGPTGDTQWVHIYCGQGPLIC